MDKKTIYTIVSKPIARWQFLLGKYFGLLLTIAVNVFIMTWIFASVMHFRGAVASDKMMAALYTITETGPEYRGAFNHIWYLVSSVLSSLFLGLWHIVSLGYDGHQITNGLFTSSLLTVMEMAIITGFAILFSSFSSPTLSAFLTVIAFVIGRLNQDLYLFAQSMVERTGMENLTGGQTIAYYFSVGAAHVCPNLSIFDQRKAFANFEPVNLSGFDLSYAFVYTLLVLFIAIMVFNRRNFK